MVSGIANRVMGRIDERDPVELTQKLIGLRSVNPPGEEKEVSKFLEIGQLVDAAKVYALTALNFCGA